MRQWRHAPAPGVAVVVVMIHLADDIEDQPAYPGILSCARQR
jgi:hypothetical protein